VAPVNPKIRHQRPKRNVKKRGLVVTEGLETETQYFELLQQELENSGTNVSIRSHGVGKDPLAVLKKCMELRDNAVDKGKPYDWVCCVVDVDEHSTLNECLKDAEANGIHVVVSNLKFEVWLLWHVDKFRKHFSSTELDRQMAKHKLTRGKHLSPSFPVRQYKQAVENARIADPMLADYRIGPNSSSSIPVLVDLMTRK
jgi:hypothetical protein